MKILLLNQVFYPDGAATAQHTADLALHLKDRGCEVTVVAGRRGYNDRSKIYPKRENYRGVEIRRVGSTGFGKRSFFTRLVDAVTFDFCLLLELLRTPKQDVVIAFTSPPLIGIFGVVFCFLKGGRLVNWLMDINPETATVVGYLKKGSLVERFLNWVFEFSLDRSSHVIVLDKWMKLRIEDHGVAAEQIVIVPPWPVHLLTPSKDLRKKNPFREEYGLENKFVIMYSGNHSIVHPLDTLLQAAVRLNHRSNIQFVFVGSGLRVQEVTDAIRENALTNVLQLPHQPRELLEASLSLADLHVVVMGNAVSGLVHASKIYGVLATGVPYVAISPERSHLVDLLAECPYGYHVEHGDVGGLLAVIEKAKTLTASELAVFESQNIQFVQRYTAEACLKPFVEEVLHLDVPSETSRAAASFAAILHS